MDADEQLRVLAAAKALSAEENWAEAAPRWEQVVTANPVDGRWWDRLAEACFELGDYHRAAQAYEQVGRLGVYDGERIVTFPGVTSYLLARCRAELGDHDGAFAALRDAMADRFVHVDRALGDQHLAALRSDARFAEVLGLEDVEDLDRDSGWRADLRLLVREAKRRRPMPMPTAMAERLEHDSAILHDDIPTLTDAQIAVRLLELLRLLDDGHAFLRAPSGHVELGRALPVQFYVFEEGVFVTSATPAYDSLLGAQVLAMDGTPIDQIVQAVDALICRDNEYMPVERVPGWLRLTAFLHALGLVEHPDKVTLQTTTHDAVVTAEPEEVARARHFPTSPTMRQLHERIDGPPRYLRHADATYWFEHIREHRMVYVQFNAVADDPAEPLEVFADRLAEAIEDDVERLVVDLRWNGGGNTFLVAPLLKRIVSCRNVDHPGGLFMIIGRRTFSAAGNTAKFLEWLVGPHLTIVGEPTGSSLQFIGETVPFELPYSRMLCNISNLYWQGTMPLDRRTWIAPDLYVPPTFEAYAGNRDPAMDAILAYVRATS